MRLRSPARLRAKASFTVEAALLMPLLTGILVLFLFLTAHVYDRSVLFSHAAAAAVTGREQDLSMLVLHRNAAIIIEENGKTRTAAASLLTDPGIGGRIFREETELVFTKAEPARLLRLKTALKAIGED